MQSIAEVVFEAKDMSNDAKHCHGHAMQTMMKLNNNQEGEVVGVEESLVAAAIVAPEETIEIPGNGAPALTASCVMFLGALLMALFV